MNRRQLLTAVPAAGLFTAVPSVLSASDTETESTFTGKSVPELPGSSAGTDSTRWYHEGPDADVRLVPNRETDVLPQTQLSFTFHNDSDDERTVSEPRLHKLVDDEWYEIPPTLEDDADTDTVAPGETLTWTVAVAEDDTQILGPGLYASAVTTNVDDSRHAAALFELSGEEPTLYPAPGASEETGVRGVDYTLEGYADAPQDGRGQLFLEFLSSSTVDERDPDARPVLEEQLYPFPALRTLFSGPDRLAFDMFSPPFGANLTREEWEEITAHFAPEEPGTDELVFQIAFDSNMGIDHFRLRYDADESAFERELVPDLPAGPAGDAPTDWYHQNPDADVRLVPDRETDVLPQSTISFTLHNDTGRDLVAPPDHSRVLKLVDGEWYETPPRGEYRDEDGTVAPGKTQAGTVTVVDDDRDTQVLGPGRYAYHVTTTRPDGETVYTAALFELGGEPPSLDPAPTATRDADDGIVRWTFEGYDEAAPAGRRQIRVDRISRADSERTAAGSRSVVAEQLEPFPVLRTAIGAFDYGTETVVTNVTRDDWEPVSTGFVRDETAADAFVLEFDGEYYHVRRDPEGSVFAGESVPSLSADSTGGVPTQWYHEDTDADVRLVPDRETNVLAHQLEVSFTLHNDTDRELTTLPDYTRLHKLVDGGWVEIPQPTTEDGGTDHVTLDPEETSTLTVTVYDGLRNNQLLGPGRYAYHVTTTRPDEETVYTAALFELGGEEPTLDPAPEAREEISTKDVDYSLVDYHYAAPEERGKLHVGFPSSDALEEEDIEIRPVVKEQLYPISALRTGFSEYDRRTFDMLSPPISVNVTRTDWEQIVAHFVPEEPTTEELFFDITFEGNMGINSFRVWYEPDVVCPE